jgi:hypothetical protein
MNSANAFVSIINRRLALRHERSRTLEIGWALLVLQAGIHWSQTVKIRHATLPPDLTRRAVEALYNRARFVASSPKRQRGDLGIRRPMPSTDRARLNS